MHPNYDSSEKSIREYAEPTIAEYGCRRRSMLMALILGLVPAILAHTASADESSKMRTPVADQGVHLTVITSPSPGITLAVAEEHADPLVTTDWYFDATTMEVELSLLNTGKSHATAWSLETAIFSPGKTKPFVMARTEDQYQHEERWLAPGHRLTRRVSVNVGEPSPKNRELLVIARVGAAVFENNESSGDPITATKILDRRSTRYQEVSRWLSLVEGELAEAYSPMDAVTAFRRLALQALEDEAVGSLTALNTGRRIQAALKRAQTEPESAILDLEALRDRLEAALNTVKEHLPARRLLCPTCDFLADARPAEPSLPTKKTCTFVAAKAAIGNICSPEGRKENWGFSCDGAPLTGGPITAKGQSNCCGSFGENDAVNKEINSTFTWTREALEGVIVDGKCEFNDQEPLSTSCPCEDQ